MSEKILTLCSCHKQHNVSHCASCMCTTVSLTVTSDYFKSSLGAGGESVSNGINFSSLFFHLHYRGFISPLLLFHFNIWKYAQRLWYFAAAERWQGLQMDTTCVCGYFFTENACSVETLGKSYNRLFSCNGNFFRVTELEEKYVVSIAGEQVLIIGNLVVNGLLYGTIRISMKNSYRRILYPFTDPATYIYFSWWKYHSHEAYFQGM